MGPEHGKSGPQLLACHLLLEWGRRCAAAGAQATGVLRRARGSPARRIDDFLKAQF